LHKFWELGAEYGSHDLGLDLDSPVLRHDGAQTQLNRFLLQSGFQKTGLLLFACQKIEYHQICFENFSAKNFPQKSLAVMSEFF